MPLESLDQLYIKPTLEIYIRLLEIVTSRHLKAFVEVITIFKRMVIFNSLRIMISTVDLII